jgi:hypothetical protein
MTEIVQTISINLKEKIKKFVRDSQSASKTQKSKNLSNIISKLNINDTNLELPYSIKQGFLNSKFDIRYNPDKLNDWNNAIKFFLLDCKHLIELQTYVDDIENEMDVDGIDQKLISKRIEEIMKSNVTLEEEQSQSGNLSSAQ